MAQLVVVASHGVTRPLGVRQRVDLVEEFLDWGAHIRGYRPGTLRSYRNTLRRVERSCCKALHELDEGDVVVFLRDSVLRNAPSTHRLYRNVLGAFYRWAIQWDHVTENPLRRIPSRPRPEPEPKPFTVKEVRQIHEAALALGSEYAALAALGLYAGLRRSELRDLRWVHFSGDMLHVRDGKGGKPRVIPAHPRLQVILERRYLHAAAFGYRTFVLQGKDGQRSSNYVGEVLWRDIRKVAGLGAGSNLHRLRHTFACAVWRGSRDLMALKDALGHESPATVAYYVKADDPALRVAVDSLDWGT